jgi:hypothetical protein
MVPFSSLSAYRYFLAVRILRLDSTPKNPSSVPLDAKARAARTSISREWRASTRLRLKHKWVEAQFQVTGVPSVEAGTRLTLKPYRITVAPESPRAHSGFVGVRSNQRLERPVRRNTVSPRALRDCALAALSTRHQTAAQALR